VLVLEIDQFRFEYLTRFRPQFVAGGFNLLLNGGANFVDCRYDYASTATGPGHASLLTGAYPNIHGIIDNTWYDRSLHREVNCVGDPDTKLVGAAEGKESSPGASPRNLIGTTLGDELRAADNFQSKVIGISLKDRAAILAGGHSANAAYWYEAKTGHFISSSYYMGNLPSWVARFNDQEPTKLYCGKSWQALPETPGAAGKTLKEALPSSGPCPNPRFLSWMLGAPFMGEVELNFAREAVKGERLGQGQATDILSVSLSINDYIGHAFGPYSAQVADTTLRTDRYLADFFRDLDRLVGLDNVWIAIAADHGVAPTPRFVQDHNLGMGMFKRGPVKMAVEQALSKAFGQDHWVESTSGVYIYLNLAALENHHVERAKAESVAAEAALTVPGIEAAFTRTQFLVGSLPDSPLARKAAHSFNPKRSGDIFLVSSPYAVAADSETSTTHGTPWSYDAQVPLMLWGSAFKPGVYTTRCEPIDLAATLAAALGLTQPSGSQGRPLSEAIK
jgi:predicted AlkP superfamily pyrophosphatase or phosphodiesterase